MSEIPDDMSDEEIKLILDELRAQVRSTKGRLTRKKKLRGGTVQSKQKESV